MSSNQSGYEVRDDPESHRYVLEVDGEQAGVAVYHVRNGRYIFVHTEVDPRLEGKGMGSALARHALEDMKERGEVIVPICPFISAYVKRHPEYHELIDQALLDKINGTG
ncbi:MAG: GNAT family N-acetyltransferase [Acidimicrobiia bacterium]